MYGLGIIIRLRAKSKGSNKRNLTTIPICPILVMESWRGALPFWILSGGVGRHDTDCAQAHPVTGNYSRAAWHAKIGQHACGGGLRIEAPSF